MFQSSRKYHENKITLTLHRRKHVTNVFVSLRQQILELAQASRPNLSLFCGMFQHPSNRDRGHFCYLRRDTAKRAYCTAVMMPMIVIGMVMRFTCMISDRRHLRLSSAMASTAGSSLTAFGLPR